METLFGNDWPRRIRNGRIACVAVLLATFCRSSYADLYTDCVLSLEWLVDSSDIICTARVTEANDDTSLATRNPVDKRRFELRDVKSLTSKIDQDTVNATLKNWTLPQFTEDGDEWLLFFRNQTDAAPYFVQGINLSRPLEHYSSAAVTCSLIALPDKRCILRAVEDRMKNGWQVPRSCDRQRIDNLSKEFHQPSRGKKTIFDYRGGFPLPNDFCDYWDQNGPYDCDTIVSVVVPAEQKYKQLLLRLISQDVVNDQVVLSLINYPGPETVDALKKYRNGEDSCARRVLSSLESPGQQFAEQLFGIPDSKRPLRHIRFPNNERE